MVAVEERTRIDEKVAAAGGEASARRYVLAGSRVSSTRNSKEKTISIKELSKSQGDLRQNRKIVNKPKSEERPLPSGKQAFPTISGATAFAELQTSIT